MLYNIIMSNETINVNSTNADLLNSEDFENNIKVYSKNGKTNPIVPTYSATLSNAIVLRAIDMFSYKICLKFYNGIYEFSYENNKLSNDVIDSVIEHFNKLGISVKKERKTLKKGIIFKKEYVKNFLTFSYTLENEAIIDNIFFTMCSEKSFATTRESLEKIISSEVLKGNKAFWIDSYELCISSVNSEYLGYTAVKEMIFSKLFYDFRKAGFVISSKRSRYCMYYHITLP